MKNLFELQDSSEIVARINQLTISSQAQWGKMEVSQMLAYCNVTYDYVYTNKYKEIGAFKKFFVKLLIKPIVVGEKKYKRNGQTAPDFVISGERDFETEKNFLIAHIEKTQELGGKHFDNKESHSFGPLTTSEWNSMFVKHLDHHLNQFGV